jgi:FG-GAP repeat
LVDKLVVCEGSYGAGAGQDVALRGDDSAIVMDQQNRVHVFKNEPGGGAWFETSEGVSPRGAFKVAVDGDTMVIGGNPGTSPRPTFVYEWSGSKWELVATLTPTPGTGAHDTPKLGDAIGISGDTIVLGDAGGFPPGGPLGSGVVFLFTKSSGIWSTRETAIIRASDKRQADRFGAAVSINGDRIVVGAPLADAQVGKAYLFERVAGEWPLTETARLIPCDGLAGDLFGSSVAVHGNRIAIGAPRSFGHESETGAVYVFEADGSREWAHVAKLAPRDRRASRTGYRVALFGDLLAASSMGSQGSVFLFEGSGSTWREDRVFASDGAVDQQFGFSVALSRDHILIGSPGDDHRNEDAGAAYVYNRPYSSNPRPAGLVPCDARPPRPPIRPGGRGEPHLISVDGLEFDCQARGDFTLLKSLESDFEIQARFTAVGQNVRASIMTGISVREFSSEPTVSVLFLNGTLNMGSGCYTEIRLFVDNAERDPASGTGLSEIVLSISDDELVLSYTSTGMAIHLLVGDSDNFGCFLNFWIDFPGGFLNEETLLGLLGTPNGDATDDWVTKENVVLDEPDTNEAFFSAAYSYCTSNWCIRDESLSLFPDIGNQPYSLVSGCDEPYLPEVENLVMNAPQPLLDICGSSIACLIDGSVGGLADAEAFIAVNAIIQQAISPGSAQPTTSGPIRAPSLDPTTSPIATTLAPSDSPSTVPTRPPTSSTSQMPTPSPSTEQPTFFRDDSSLPTRFPVSIPSKMSKSGAMMMMKKKKAIKKRKKGIWKKPVPFPTQMSKTATMMMMKKNATKKRKKGMGKKLVTSPTHAMKKKKKNSMKQPKKETGKKHKM